MHLQLPRNREVVRDLERILTDIFMGAGSIGKRGSAAGGAGGASRSTHAVIIFKIIQTRVNLCKLV